MKLNKQNYRIVRAITILSHAFTVGMIADMCDRDWKDAKRILDSLQQEGVVSVAIPEHGKREEYTLSEAGATGLNKALEEYEDSIPISPRKCKSAGPYYYEAVELLRGIQSGKLAPSRESLKKVADLLEFGQRFDETLGPPKAREIVSAYYNLAFARLRFLQGRGEEGMGLRDRGEAILARYGLKPPK